MRLFLTPRKRHPFANKGAQELQEKTGAQPILGPLTPLLAIRSESTARLKAHPITPVKTSRPRIATAAAQHNLARWKTCSSHMLADREICVGAGGNNANKRAV